MDWAENSKYKTWEEIQIFDECTNIIIIIIIITGLL